MIDTRITKKRVRDHFAYSAWKYVVLAVAAVFGWNLIYSATAYRPPADKKVDVYFVTYALASEATEALQAMAAPAFEDMEALNFFSIGMSGDESGDYYANIQLTTYIGAQEGDVFLMEADRFRTFADSGLFVPLDAWIADGTIDLRGLDAGTGRMTAQETDAEGQPIQGTLSIPARTLYGLMEYGVDNRNLYIGVTAYSRNPENAAKMVDWLIGQFSAPAPEWVLEQEKQAAQGAGSGAADGPAPLEDGGVLPSY